MYYLKAVLAAGIAIATFTGAALAQGKPQEIKIGITTFLSGPASVFGTVNRGEASVLCSAFGSRAILR